MTIRIAISGFGRIGRLVLRTMLERHKNGLMVAAVNDMADLKTNAHLFRYDSQAFDLVRPSAIVSRTDIVNAIAMGKHVTIPSPVYDL